MNIKLVEIAHRAKELDTKLKEVRKEREGRNDDAEEEETTADEEKEEKKCGPRGDDAVSMWTLTAAFESEVLRTAAKARWRSWVTRTRRHLLQVEKEEMRRHCLRSWKSEGRRI